MRLGLSLAHDHVPSLVGTSGREHRLEFQRCLPSGVLRDPDLASAVKQFGLSTADLPRAAWSRVGRTGRLDLLAPNHGWALWAWSRWWVRRGMPPTATIVHVDAHDDLVSPPLALGRSPVELVDAASGKAVRLDQPHTVADAIEKGLVGIGSFILPFLRTLEGFTYLHISPFEVPADRLDGGTLIARPHGWRRNTFVLGLVRRQGAAGGGTVFASAHDFGWARTHSLAGPILLDIDFDFFANDFDSSSPDQPASDPRNVETELNRFFDDLVGQPWFRNVEVVTAALSPGFFPARFWSLALGSLRAHGLSPI